MPCPGRLPGTVITTACVGALWRRLLRGPRVAATSPEQVEQARAALAGAVLAQWRAEAALRHLGDPLPIGIRWGPTRLPVATTRMSMPGRASGSFLL